MKVEDESNPGMELLLSILRSTAEGHTTKEIAEVNGIEDRYLDLWLSVLVHFKCLRRNSAGTGYDLTQKGNDLVQSFNLRKLED